MASTFGAPYRFLPEVHRRDDVDVVLDRESDDLLEPLLVDAARQPAEAGPAGVHLRHDVVRGDRLHVPVQVVDRRHARLDGMHEADVDWDVSSKPQPDLAGDGDHVVPRPRAGRRDGSSAGRSRPPGARRMSRSAFGRSWCRIPVYRGGTHVEVRPENLVRLQLVGQRDLVRGAQHPPDRGDAVGEVEEEDVLDVLAGRIGPGRNVGMHLGQPRHQVPTGAVDDRRARSHGDIVRRTDRRDRAVDHDDCLILQHHLAVHRKHAHVGERDGARCGLARRAGSRRHQSEHRGQRSLSHDS